MMTKSISRFDKRYKEVEKFKPYELTQCIAYEMAIRNPEIIQLAQKRDTYFSDVFKDFDDEWMGLLNRAKNQKELDKLLLAYMKVVPGRIEVFNSYLQADKELAESCYFKIPITSNTKINERMENAFFISYQSRSSQRAQAQRTHIINDDKLDSYFDDDGSAKTIAGSIIKYVDLFPEFSRPLPLIPTEASKEIDLLLNLALPTEELTSYIEQIKKVYDKNSADIFKTVSLDDDTVTIGSEILSIQIKMKKKGSRFHLDMPEKKRQEVYADLLFLYDVLNTSDIKKQGDKIQHFQNELIDYYAKKVCVYNNIKDIDEVTPFIGTPREQTVREYNKMMKHYIEDYGYRHLLT